MNIPWRLLPPPLPLDPVCPLPTVAARRCLGWIIHGVSRGLEELFGLKIFLGVSRVIRQAQNLIRASHERCVLVFRPGLSWPDTIGRKTQLAGSLFSKRLKSKQLTQKLTEDFPLSISTTSYKPWLFYEHCFDRDLWSWWKVFRDRSIIQPMLSFYCAQGTREFLFWHLKCFTTPLYVNGLNYAIPSSDFIAL